MLKYEAYKDSGAAWIGNVPSTWEVDRLKKHLKRTDEKNPGGVQVLSLYRELGIVPKDSRDDNHNVTSEDTSKYKYVQPGDFVVNKMKAWQGSVAVSDYEGIVSPAYYVYKFLDDCFHKRYFHYLIRSCYKEEFMRLSAGIRIGQWDLSSDDLDCVLVLLPTKEEQEAIADFLDKKVDYIDSIISEAKASIEEYKAWKASIIYEAVTRGLDPDVEMKDSGVEWIGDIPDTWSLRKIKNIASTGSGGTPKSDIREYYDGGINWVCSLDLHEQSISETKNTLSELGLQNCASEIRPIGTVVMAMYGGSGTIGNSGILRNPCATNQAICCIMFGDKIIPDYGFYYIRAIRPYWMIYAVGTRKDPNISQAVVSEMPMVVPSLEEQESIIRHLDKTVGAIDCLIEEKETLVVELESYKKSLVFEVVTGKRKVVHT